MLFFLSGNRYTTYLWKGKGCLWMIVHVLHNTWVQVFIICTVSVRWHACCIIIFLTKHVLFTQYLIKNEIPQFWQVYCYTKSLPENSRSSPSSELLMWAIEIWNMFPIGYHFLFNIGGLSFSRYIFFSLLEVELFSIYPDWDKLS